MASELEELTKAVKALTEQFKGGNSRPTNAQLSSSIPSIPSISSLIPGMDTLKAVVADVNTAMNDWQSATSKHGISFNNDILGLTNSVGKTRMSMDSWNEAIESGKVGFTSLGGTMSDSARKFNKLSSDFSDSSFADPLREMGVGLDEYNKLLAITVSGNTRLNKDNKAAQDEAFRATNELALEMDKVAQLTGISRKAQMDKLEQDKLDGKWQASQMLRRTTGGEESVTANTVMINAANAKGLGDLTKQLASGQKLSEKSNAQLFALGDAGTQYKAAVLAMSQATTETQRTAAKAQLEVANTAINTRIQSENFLKSTRLEGKESDAASELLIQNMSAAAGQAAQAASSGVDAATAATQLNEKVAAGQVGQVAQADGTRRVEEGAQTSKFIVDANARHTDLKAMLSDIKQAINQKAGKELEGSPVLSGVKNVKLNTETGKEEGFLQRKGGIDAINKIPDVILNGKWEAIPGIMSKAGTQFEELSKNILGGVGNMVATVTGTDANKSMGPGEIIPDATTAEQTKKPKFSSGSKDVLGGEWFGNFGAGTDVTVHGNEAIVPKNKLEEFSADMFGKNLSSGSSSISGKSPATTPADVKQAPGAIAPIKPTEPKVEEKSPITGILDSIGNVSGDLWKSLTKDEEPKVEEKSPLTGMFEGIGNMSGDLWKSLTKDEEPKVEEKSPITPDYKKVSGMGSFTTEKISAALDKKLTTGSPTPEIKTPPIEVAKPKAADLAKPKVEEPVKPKVEEPKIAPQTATITLKDLNDQLTKLNTTMNKLAHSHTELVHVNEKTLRATKKNSNDLNQH